MVKYVDQMNLNMEQNTFTFQNHTAYIIRGIHLTVSEHYWNTEGLFFSHKIENQLQNITHFNNFTESNLTIKREQSFFY